MNIRVFKNETACRIAIRGFLTHNYIVIKLFRNSSTVSFKVSGFPLWVQRLSWRTRKETRCNQQELACVAGCKQKLLQIIIDLERMAFRDMFVTGNESRYLFGGLDGSLLVLHLKKGRLLSVKLWRVEGGDENSVSKYWQMDRLEIEDEVKEEVLGIADSILKSLRDQVETF